MFSRKGAKLLRRANVIDRFLCDFAPLREIQFKLTRYRSHWSALPQSQNTTHGSGWIVRWQPYGPDRNNW